MSGAPLTCPDAPVDRKAVGWVVGSGAADRTQADVCTGGQGTCLSEYGFQMWGCGRG